MMMDCVEVATLIIAVLGLVLSVASLTWQAATFVLSGSRVRADLKYGAANAAGALTGPPGSTPLVSLIAQGFTDEVLGVEVRNLGRLAATVDRVQVAIAGGIKLQTLLDVKGPSLPHRLEPQSSASWFVPAAPARRAVAVSAQVLKRADPCKVWMEVDVVGKAVRTRQSVRLGSRPELDR
jgi:hypothetical protein